MIAYKFEVVVINNNEMSLDAIQDELTRSRHINAEVIGIEEADIGE